MPSPHLYPISPPPLPSSDPQTSPSPDLLRTSTLPLYSYLLLPLPLAFPIPFDPSLHLNYLPFPLYTSSYTLSNFFSLFFLPLSFLFQPHNPYLSSISPLLLNTTSLSTLPLPLSSPFTPTPNLPFYRYLFPPLLPLNCSPFLFVLSPLPLLPLPLPSSFTPELPPLSPPLPTSPYLIEIRSIRLKC